MPSQSDIVQLESVREGCDDDEDEFDDDESMDPSASKSRMPSKVTTAASRVGVYQATVKNDLHGIGFDRSVEDGMGRVRRYSKQMLLFSALCRLQNIVESRTQP